MFQGTLRPMKKFQVGPSPPGRPPYENTKGLIICHNKAVRISPQSTTQPNEMALTIQLQFEFPQLFTGKNFCTEIFVVPFRTEKEHYLYR